MYIIKKKSYLCSLLILTFSLGNMVPALANENALDKQAKVYQEVIEQNTGLDDVISDISSNKKYEAITDGTNTIVKIPKDPSKPIIVKHAYEDEKSFSINMPSNITANTVPFTSKNGTVVYCTTGSSASIGVQAVSDSNMEGVRSLITIGNKTAPKEYSFHMNLSEGTHLVTAAEYLGAEFDTKETYIVNSANIIVGIIDAPWAKDANGNDVDTYYSLSGNTITQVVNFTENNAFPIVADPTAWEITKCVGAITWAIGSGVFAAAKLLKVKKYIAALGGIRTAASLLMSATTAEERLEAGGTSLLNLASLILGIDEIKEDCYF